jgi:Chaperone of endosialidase
MKKLIQSEDSKTFIAVIVTVSCFALLPIAQAVVPAPDGGYPGGNTAEGQNALFSLTAGGFNTAVGYVSLRSDTTGSFNTAVGAGTLFANMADENTATGAAALLSNTMGFANTADGALALFNNVSGSNNTALGHDALINNIGGNANTAIGGQALQSNTGSQNTAIGQQALSNNTSGSLNIAVGFHAGTNITAASNVICIGADGNDVDNSCFIGNIFGATSSNGVAVLVNSNGRLGTTTSSARFKDEIKPMDRASEALFGLKPVVFRYKKNVDPAGTMQLGLVAEDVEKVNPDLIVRDKAGKPYSVRYDQVNAMLLNEFLKEHRKVEELTSRVAKQEVTIAQQQKDFQCKLAKQGKQIEALTSGLQKVSAEIELNKSVARVAEAGQ